MFDTSTKRLFFFAPHRVAIETILRPILAPDVKLISVDRDERLRGLVGGAFVIVSDHPERLPREIGEILRINGFLIIELDDGNCRARAIRASQGLTLAHSK